MLKCESARVWGILFEPVFGPSPTNIQAGCLTGYLMSLTHYSVGDLVNWLIYKALPYYSRTCTVYTLDHEDIN